MITAYCPACRTYCETHENPPYAALHLEDGTHVHPITREALREAQ